LTEDNQQQHLARTTKFIGSSWYLLPSLPALPNLDKLKGIDKYYKWKRSTRRPQFTQQNKRPLLPGHYKPFATYRDTLSDLYILDY